MQANDEKFYKAVGDILKKKRLEKGLKLTIFCYENDIATSSLNVIENGYSQAYFSKIAKVIQALDMSYEEFGKLLDEYISKDFFKTD